MSETDLFFSFRERSSGFRVALKQIKSATIAKFNLSANVANEIRVQSQLEHPNIIRLYGYFCDKDSVYLI